MSFYINKVSKHWSCSLAVLLLFTLVFCSKEHNDKKKYSDADNFSSIPYPKANPQSKEGVLLGQMLFFDKRLSTNGNVSCASCHQPELAFTDGLQFPQGLKENASFRNTPPIFNLAWHREFFWDGGARNLESLMFAPITHPNEMGMPLKQAIALIQNDKKYPNSFLQAFGTDSVYSALIARALAQYVRSIVSFNSKYDRHLRNEVELDSLEMDGLAIFQQKCSSCHSGLLFTDLDYHNIGLDSIFDDRGELDVLLGRFRITNDSIDIGKYKTPSLRNLNFTFPYMHDGRFETLDRVLDHYSFGIKESRFLDKELQKDRVFLGGQDRTKLIAFLSTLNDSSLIAE